MAEISILTCECKQFPAQFELGYDFISGFPDPRAPFEFFEQKFLPKYTVIGSELREFSGYWWPDETDPGTYPHWLAPGQIYECNLCRKHWLVVPNAEMPSYLFADVDADSFNDFVRSGRLPRQPDDWVNGYVRANEAAQENLAKRLAPRWET